MMPLIEEIRLKGLLEEIEGVVRGDGFREEYVLSSETPESCISGAITEIFYNVGGFDDWFFDTGDERALRIPSETVSSNNEPLVQVVRDVVTYNLEELEGEWDTEDIVTKLVGYIVTWQDWYYDYKVLQDRSHWYENVGINREIYETEGDYGVGATGLSNMYDEDENVPWSELDIEAIEERVFMGPTTLSDEVITQSEAGGTITLSPQVTEFHLPGQHDQGGHGKGGTKLLSSKKTVSQSPEDAALILRVTTATETRKLTGGRSGASVEIIKSPSGKAVKKSHITREVADKEYLVSIVGRALGAPVPRVARVDSHTLVSDFVEGSPAGTFKKDIGRFIPKDRAARERTVHLEGARELGMLDIATANADRHGGNAMISPNGKSVVGIDHGTVFGGKAVYGIRPAKVFEKEWRGSFTKKDYDGALGKIRGVKGDFEKLGRGDWYRGMEERLKEGAGEPITLSEGFITLSDAEDPRITDFHLPGQHDQGSHGGKGGSSSPEDTALLKKVETATDRKSLAGGRSGAGVEILKGPMGKAVIKSGLTKDDMDAEVLASKVGRALGATVPTVVRMPGGKVGGYQVAIDYTPGKMAGTFGRDIGRVLPRDNDKRSLVRGLKGSRELGMMDIAIRNADRHGGNIMIRPGGKSIAGIDHAKSFRVHRVLHEAKPLSDKWKKDFSRGDFEGALEKIRPLKREFSSRNQTEWFDNMIGRLEKGAEKAGVTGSITLSVPVIEFHLPGQHDQSSHGTGGMKLTSRGNSIQTLDRKANKDEFLDSVNVKPKDVYGITAADGKTLKMYDLTGEAGQYKGQLLGQLLKMHESYPMDPPRRIVIVSTKLLRGTGIENHAGWTDEKRPHIFLNKSVLFEDVGFSAETSIAMPSATKANLGRYMLSHEYGHQVDFNSGFKSGGGLYEDARIKGHLSKYGNTMKQEGYAEAFAEWHITDGGTKNPAARAYARQEGWITGSMVSSGGLITMGVEALELDLFKTPRDGVTIIERLDENGPVILGNLPTVEPTEEELDRARVILEEIFPGAVGDEVTGSITLSSTEFHLPGQHDQGSHGGMSGGSKYASSPEEKALLDRETTALTRKQLGGGRSGARVELVKGPGGKAVLKGGIMKEDADKEYLSSKVGKALGANVPLVARKGPNTIVLEYVTGEVAGGFLRDIGRVINRSGDEGARKRVHSLQGAKELALLDIAIGNKDRHGGNIMIRQGGKSIVGIDHTTSFGSKAFLRVRPSKALERHWKGSFTEGDYRGAIQKIQGVKGDFERLGRGDWFDGMEERLGRGFESTLGSTGTIILSGGEITLSEPGDPGVLEFHLPGQHDQGSHGKGNGGTKLRSWFSPTARQVLEDADTTWDNLDRPQRRAVSSYGRGGYIDTNNVLRGDPVVRGTLEMAREQIAGLDSVFRDHSVDTRGITVYRGTNMDLTRSKVGDILQDDGFLSTSIDRDQMARFRVDRPNPVEMSIRTQQGTRGILGNAAHMEIVLNRSTPQRITKIEHCPDGICRVEVDSL